MHFVTLMADYIHIYHCIRYKRKIWRNKKTYIVESNVPTLNFTQFNDSYHCLSHVISFKLALLFEYMTTLLDYLELRKSVRHMYDNVSAPFSNMHTPIS